MFKSMFTNVMTGSDDKARWALAYVEFGLSEVLSGIIGSTDPRRRICGIGGTDLLISSEFRMAQF
jgi:hypothetical protein